MYGHRGVNAQNIEELKEQARRKNAEADNYGELAREEGSNKEPAKEKKAPVDDYYTMMDAWIEKLNGPDVTGCATKVGFWIAKLSKKEGYSYMSYGWLAEKTGVSRPSAIAAVKQLEAKGLLTVEKRRKGPKHHDTNKFRLVVSRLTR